MPEKEPLSGLDKLLCEIDKGQEIESRNVREGGGLEYFILREAFTDGAARVENQPMREQRGALQSYIKQDDQRHKAFRRLESHAEEALREWQVRAQNEKTNRVPESREPDQDHGPRR